MHRCPREGPSRGLTNENIICPSCGREVEIFSDETEARCSCGVVVSRKGPPPTDMSSPE